ncbi:unnamed protein product, partial [Closterium sp. NIES-54]
AAAARTRVAGVVEGAARVVVGAAVEVVEAVEVVAAVGVVVGVGGGGKGSGGSGGGRTGGFCGGSGGGQRQWQQRPSETPSSVAIFDLDYDAILSAMYALSASAEGDCYRCVPPDPGIEAAGLGASEYSLPGTAPAETLHTRIKCLTLFLS